MMIFFVFAGGKNRNKPRGAGGLCINEKAAMTAVSSNGEVIGPFKVSKPAGTGVGSYSGRKLGSLWPGGTGKGIMKTLNQTREVRALREDKMLLAEEVDQSQEQPCPIIRLFEYSIIPEEERINYKKMPRGGWKTWREIEEWDVQDWSSNVPASEVGWNR